jgi:hypothetical protein
MPRRLTPTRAAIFLVPLLCAFIALPTAASPKSDDRATVARWLDDKRAWEDLSEIAEYLDSDYPEVRANALIAFINLCHANQALKNPKQIANEFTRSTASKVAEALGNLYPLMDATYRNSSLEIALQLNARDQALIPLLLFAIADESPAIRDRAKPIAAVVFRHASVPWVVSSQLVRFLERSDLPETVAKLAHELIDKGGPAARSFAIDNALYDLACSKEGAASLLKMWHAAESPLARIAAETPKRGPFYRTHLESLFQDRIYSSEAATERVAMLLTSDDALLQEIAGAFAIADPARIGARRTLESALGTGRSLDANAIKSLQLEPLDACNEIAAILNAPKVTTSMRIAALGTLKPIGLHGDAISLAVHRLSEDADDSIRYAAGEVLKRQDIMDRARIPGLLRDLRAASSTLRLTAANQLDSLAIEPAPLTKALVRATTSGDMPAREGLLRAIERARAEKKDSLDMLKRLAAAPEQLDPLTRAYARAALRAIATVP